MIKRRKTPTPVSVGHRPAPPPPTRISSQEAAARVFLPSIHVPVLVIQGRQDEYGTLAQVDAISRQVASSQVLILEECGHTPHRDQPEQTLRAMHAFIAQLRCQQ